MKTMLLLTELNGDDIEFLALANRITMAFANEFSPKRLIVVRIDNWFDFKWLTFSGLIHQHVGFWNKKLTVPAFNPNRVLEEHHYLNAGSSWEPIQPKTLVHRKVPAGEGVSRRFLDREFPDTLLIWISGQTKANGKGSYMAYVPTADGWWPWYAGMENHGDWKICGVRGIGRAELEARANVA